MNPAAHPNNSAGQPPTPAFTVDDALYTLFKHKWVIFICLCLGIVSAAIAYKVTPVMYSSGTQLLVTYVSEDYSSLKNTVDDERLVTADSGVNILAPEMEIVQSLDTAKIVATNIGPERILATKGGGNDPAYAAGIIRSGITVIAPRSSKIMGIVFENQDKELVQPVLTSLIQTYLVEHYKYHSSMFSEAALAEKKAEVDAKLASVDAELREKMHDLGVVDPDASMRVYDGQTERLNNDLISARTELEERTRILQELDPAAVSALNANATNNSVPPEKLDEYNLILDQLSQIAKSERDLRMQEFTEDHPRMVALRANQADLVAKQKELEQQYPSLASGSQFLGSNGTPGGIDVTEEMGKIRELGARVDAISAALNNVKNDAFQLSEIQPQLDQLKRDRNELVAHQTFLANEQNKKDEEAIDRDTSTNIKIIENPTPPVVNNRRRLKLTGALFGGFLGLGLGAGFLMDLVLDRTVKRSADIKRRLHLPVFLSIPDTSWALTNSRNGNSHGAESTRNGDVGHLVAPWEESHHLHSFIEGLRERLVTYFDINNLTHKPKLVAVAGCGLGVGVTTLATGLAASVSKIGDGNVLLVDMTNGQGVVKSFYKGKPGAAEPAVEEAAEAQAEGEFSAGVDGQTKPAPKILPKQFTNLVPVLEAKNYDYIIFDMPAVSPTSVTPRLASHMDLVLLVLESEKTGQGSASRAGALLAEARANTVVVLNKCRRYVPERLSPEL